MGLWEKHLTLLPDLSFTGTLRRWGPTCACHKVGTQKCHIPHVLIPLLPCFLSRKVFFNSYIRIFYAASFFCSQSMIPQTWFKHLLCVKAFYPYLLSLTHYLTQFASGKLESVHCDSHLKNRTSAVVEKEGSGVSLHRSNLCSTLHCVILGQWLTLSVPFLWNGGKSRTYLLGFHKD